MAIRFEHNGTSYEADTPEQAAWLIDWLDNRAFTRAKAVEYHYDLSKVLTRHPGITPSPPDESVWTPDIFRRFIERLGPAQKAALEGLILHRSLSDEALRDVVGARNNQALAGVLSGISKQALRCGIGPRAVFITDTIRSAGTRRNTYEIAPTFLDMARSLDWPPASTAPLQK